jgi:hypothetical protein
MGRGRMAMTSSPLQKIETELAIALKYDGMEQFVRLMNGEVNHLPQHMVMGERHIGLCKELQSLLFVPASASNPSLAQPSVVQLAYTEPPSRC